MRNRKTITRKGERTKRESSNEREFIEDVQKVVLVRRGYKARECDRTAQGRSGWDGTEQDKGVEDRKEETTREKKNGTE
jgi:hypothetical protein